MLAFAAVEVWQGRFDAELDANPLVVLPQAFVSPNEIHSHRPKTVDDKETLRRQQVFAPDAVLIDPAAYKIIKGVKRTHESPPLRILRT